ncbi:hypothetical protein ASG92_06750 [Arthrobacter sp. Soil736]|uniref:hypothetical protein n=1 Tax=Arthrobacter sp. Soil736 TaxID=1736395 RepID=UPI0006FBAB48|nr:hypothetical protein [Arthrobacter sp. Soil736]KRE53232.1 hypothetical protein ASG92_06750 [Arthrobacter sp. Soil736]
MKNLARPLTAAALFAVAALTACSAPTAGSAPSSASSSSPSSSGSPSASASPSSGPFGGYASAAEACAAISEQATGASLLPMSAAQGKTAELEQKKADLNETAERVPDALKADFAKLDEVAVAGLKDQTVYSSGQFQNAMAPVTKWLAANCS